MSSKPTKAQRREAQAQARAARQAAEAKKSKQRRLFVVLGGGLAIAIVAVAIMAAINREDGSDAALAAVAPVSTNTTLAAQNGRSIGDESAPVVIVEYGDYQCPFCG